MNANIRSTNSDLKQVIRTIKGKIKQWWGTCNDMKHKSRNELRYLKNLESIVIGWHHRNLVFASSIEIVLSSYFDAWKPTISSSLGY